ncbi:LysR family transcriptional regulator, partial [Ideonella azotifigens]
MNNPLEALRVFCCAAQARNFRDAAQQLAVSPQVVTRVVRELEDTLGEPLFHRSTRGVRLTAFGAQLVERARSALAGVEALFPVRGQPGQVNETTSGLVRVTAPRFLGRAPL